MIRVHLGAGHWPLHAPVALPDSAARHLQVLRVQPGDGLECFDGAGSAWRAVVRTMGRREVWVELQSEAPASDAELPCAVTLAIGMPANDRMDNVVEKAVELGAAVIQPLICERSVLRLSGDRAVRKVQHWQAVAVSAAEQCGRRVVPQVAPVRALDAWLRWQAGQGPEGDSGNGPTVDRTGAPAGGRRDRILLSLASLPVQPMPASAAGGQPEPAAVHVLSGPEGGLSPDEEAAAVRAGFVPTSLGPRILRADTAPLAWLAAFGLGAAWRQNRPAGDHRTGD